VESLVDINMRNKGTKDHRNAEISITLVKFSGDGGYITHNYN